MMSSKVAVAEGGYGGPITGFVARPTVSCRLPMPQWLCSPAQSMARPTSMTTQCEASTEIFWATAVKLHTIGLHWPRAHWTQGSIRARKMVRAHARIGRSIPRPRSIFHPIGGDFSSAASDVETKIQILKLKASPTSLIPALALLVACAVALYVVALVSQRVRKHINSVDDQAVVLPQDAEDC